MENLHIDQHISRKYNEELEDLRNKVLVMGGMVEKQCKNALDALIKGDSSLAATVATSDYQINSLEVEIDAECTEILARRQPAASDLRLILTVIKTIAHLERIGDEAEKIGRFALKLANSHEAQSYYSELHHLGELVIEMLHDSLDSFARMDVQSAVLVASRDPVVDQEFEAITRMLITHMMEDPREVKNVLRLNWCARSLERIGDHSNNICEYVIYLVKGHDVRHVSLQQIQEKYIGNS
ncbi:phosphate signaling complex protein PhoU [Gammaproteobacteria bacterium]|nr:phosphate signaling complex protein PhoU [Gammaproteobacteria bacterium]